MVKTQEICSIRAPKIHFIFKRLECLVEIYRSGFGSRHGYLIDV